MFKQLIDSICFRLISGSPPIEFHISKMELKPGEFLVMRFKRHISQKEADNLRENVRGFLPNNKVLVFDGDVDLSVLAPVQIVKAA